MEQVFITIAHIDNAVITTTPMYIPTHINNSGEIEPQRCMLNASVYTRCCGQEDISMIAYGKLADICARMCSIGVKVSVVAKPSDSSNTKFIIDNIVIEKMPEQVTIDVLLAGVSPSTIMASQTPPIGSISIRLVPVIKEEK